MTRLWSFLLFLALPQAVLAQSQDAAFGERVRAYILANPEVILEAPEVLSERERVAAMQARVAAFPELFTDAPRLGIGSPGADITVVEFFDYKCAPCKAVHPRLVDFVAQNPEVRIEMRQLPILSPGSERAARFAMAVHEVHGDAAYAQVHDRLWQQRGALNTPVFERIADALGLDFAKIAPKMEAEAIDARITYNRDLAIALEILGTPAFVTPTSVIFGTTDIDLLAADWLSQ
jgi:protein-disulfide isomerase